jgi:hypothetical protein
MLRAQTRCIPSFAATSFIDLRIRKYAYARTSLADTTSALAGRTRQLEISIQRPEVHPRRRQIPALVKRAGDRNN